MAALLRMKQENDDLTVRARLLVSLRKRAETRSKLVWTGMEEQAAAVQTLTTFSSILAVALLVRQ